MISSKVFVINDEDEEEKITDIEKYYDNNDGTETLMYIHRGHKMPLKIETLKDRKVIDTVQYENIEFNHESSVDSKEI